MTRRDFLIAGAVAGGGFVLAFTLPRAPRTSRVQTTSSSFAPNAWLRITPDGDITILVDKSEMGQGVLTALPMILADELDADWSRVRAEHAPTGPEYRNPDWGVQQTGGSASVRSSWMPLRRAGAAAREMLRRAAAEAWEVPPDECDTRDGRVYHAASGRSLGYGELALRAAALPIPRSPRLKTPAQFRLIGTQVPRLDTPAKVAGTAVYGIDVSVPGMLVAVVERLPVLGAIPVAMHEERVHAMRGVRNVVRLARGVAVVADGYWQAEQGRRALQVEWRRAEGPALDSAGIARAFEARAQRPLATTFAHGRNSDVADARRLRLTYELPFLAHAPMEPMNCTAHVTADRCDIWAPTQAQESSAREAERITGLPPHAIHVHTTMLGGGFGRRSQTDFVAEAAELSKAIDAPVKVIWSREDDLRHGYYRPASRHQLDIGIGADGLPASWLHRVVSSERDDPGHVESIDMLGDDFPYPVPSRRVEFGGAALPVRMGIWRSVGYSATGFVVESAIDEIAAASGADPVELRRRLLATRPRPRAVLELAAARADWGGALPAGRARGVALVPCFDSIVAQVAEVSVENGRVRVHRVVCAVDCGQVINPSIVAAQMESGILYGLSAALGQEISWRGGAVEQGSFADYPIIRIDESPSIDVHIVKSTAPPGGVGEPGTPPIAPAVTNAIFAATGERIRRLPIHATARA